MGLFGKIAKAMQSKGRSDEQNPPSGERIRKSTVYREAPFSIPAEATRDDLAKALDDLISRGEVTKDAVKASLEGIVDVTREKLKDALVAGRLLDDVNKAKLLKTVKARFKKHASDPQSKRLQKMRKGVEWEKVQAKLEANPEKIWSLNEMERTGGEPDVVGYDKKTGEYIFWDLSGETPSKRTFLCYDAEAESEVHRLAWTTCRGNAVDMAINMGITILDDNEYTELQKLGSFDTNTKSWVKRLGKRKIGQHRALVGTGNRSGCEDLTPIAYGKELGFRGSLRV